MFWDIGSTRNHYVVTTYFSKLSLRVKELEKVHSFYQYKLSLCRYLFFYQIGHVVSRIKVATIINIII